jgi:alkanesulfonate monooxygenase SsuD/methylene tetrahydromethanopterin reductase-like flavin-dependent oxidoreductase (luciferase family)
MNSYLERLLSAPLQSPLASEPAEIVIAGHAPGLQKVAAKKADGLFLFLQTLETVKNARKIIGPEKSLPVAVRCVLDDNPTSARNLARKACAFYMS